MSTDTDVLNENDIEVEKNEWNSIGSGTVYCGDCLEGLKSLEDDSVTLGFTSPPYFDAINYEDHIEKKLNATEEGYWEREDLDYAAYRQFLMERFEELYRVTRPGGHTVVNLSPVHSDGERVPLPYHFVSWMENKGWSFQEDIIWEKPVAKDRRSGVLLQHPYPGYYYPSVVAEYVLVFKKEADSEKKNNIYWNRTEEEKDKNRIDVDVGYQGEKSKNVWKIRPVAPNEINHPAPFPQKLAERVIEFYSYKNDSVIDIFGGSGQTYLAAKELERDFVGFDVQKEYVELSLKRVLEYTRKNPSKIDKINQELEKIQRKQKTLDKKQDKLRDLKNEVLNESSAKNNQHEQDKLNSFKNQSRENEGDKV